MGEGTLGKLAVSLRVIGLDGAAPSVAQCFKREAFVALGAIPFASPGRQCQRLGLALTLDAVKEH
jgi:hypothetical protein